MAPKLGVKLQPAASLTSSPGPVKLPKLPTLPTSPLVDAQRKPTSSWGLWAQLVGVLGLGEPYVVFVLGACRLLLLGYGVACLMGHAWGYGAAFITHCVIGVLGLLLGVRLQVSVSPRPPPPWLRPYPQGSRAARRQLACPLFVGYAAQRVSTVRQRPGARRCAGMPEQFLSIRRATH